MLRGVDAADGHRRVVRRLSLPASLLALGACAVPPSMEVRRGVSPAYEDENVRFRTTYYFRVFDVCEGRVALSPRMEGIPQGFLGEKPRGPYYYKTDSLYRFVMTGKANALASKVHFESGSLRKEQIDPFGTSVHYSQTSNGFVVTTPDENRALARQEEVIGQIRQLAELKTQLGGQSGSAALQINGLIRQNLDQLSPTGRPPLADIPSPEAQLNQANANDKTASDVVTAVTVLNNEYDPFSRALPLILRSFDPGNLPGTSGNELEAAGASWSDKPVSKELRAATAEADRLVKSVTGTSADETAARTALQALARAVQQAGDTAVAAGKSMSGLKDSGGSVTNLDTSRDALTATAVAVETALGNVAGTRSHILKLGTPPSLDFSGLETHLKDAQADLAIWRGNLATFEARSVLASIPAKRDLTDLTTKAAAWKKEAAALASLGKTFADAGAATRATEGGKFKDKSKELLKAAKDMQGASTKLLQGLSEDVRKVHPKLAGRDLMPKTLGAEVDKISGPAGKLDDAIAKLSDTVRASAERTAALDTVAGVIAGSPAASQIESNSTDLVVCENGIPARRGFQVLGPEGYRTFDQNERLLMGMSSSAKPLIGTLQALSNRMLDARRGQADTNGRVAAERLRVDRAAGIYDTITAIDTQGTVPASDLAKRVRESFEANPASGKK